MTFYIILRLYDNSDIFDILQHRTAFHDVLRNCTYNILQHFMTFLHFITFHSRSAVLHASLMWFNYFQRVD